MPCPPFSIAGKQFGADDERDLFPQALRLVAETRPRAAWRALGVDGLGIADEAPGADFPVTALPKLTTRMVARVQGFPDEWGFRGRKTAAYRQVGNAFPPPVARALGEAIRAALS